MLLSKGLFLELMIGTKPKTPFSLTSAAYPGVAPKLVGLGGTAGEGCHFNPIFASHLHKNFQASPALSAGLLNSSSCPREQKLCRAGGKCPGTVLVLPSPCQGACLQLLLPSSSIVPFNSLAGKFDPNFCNRIIASIMQYLSLLIILSWVALAN